MQDGFGLIELMISLAIATILMMIALPNYRVHVAKVRTYQAQVALLQVAHELQESYYRTQDYRDFDTRQLITLSTKLHYTLQLQRLRAHQFYLTAVADAPQRRANPMCRELAIDQNGTVFAPQAKQLSYCWKS